MTGREAAPVRATGSVEPPPGARTLFVVVEIVAVGLTLLTAFVVPATGADVPRLLALLVLQVTYVEIVRVIRARSTYPGRGGHADLGSVVVFAGVLLLPPVLTAVVVVVGYLYEPHRLDQPRPPPHRTAYLMAGTVLAGLAAWAARAVVDAGWPADPPADPRLALPAVLVAIVAYLVVDRGLVAVAVATTERRLRGCSGTVEDNLLGLATVALGALTAAALVGSPWLAVAVLPAMVVMRRAMLVPQLTVDSRIDAKTGLLNMATWCDRAVAALAAAPGARPHAVLIIDVDHFKAVNDTYGHVVGDVVLAAVADTIARNVRTGDLLGRFGGEEFVVLTVPDAPGTRGAETGEVIAHRVRRAVAVLRVPTGDGGTVGGLRVSVGVAQHRDRRAATHDAAAHDDLAELLRRADDALYSAKRGGRDQVCVAPTAPGR